MNQRVVGVLAGDNVSPLWLRPWLIEADLILAADGGADLVMEAGFRPNVLVGDFDSVSIPARELAGELVYAQDQDHSDSEKLLSLASARDVSSLVLLGLDGSRLDHMLHTLHAICLCRVPCVLAYTRALGRVITGPAHFSISCESTISAIPLNRCEGVSITGVKWPVVNSTLECGIADSLSNQGLGLVEVSIRTGHLLVTWLYDGKPTWSNSGF